MLVPLTATSALVTYSLVAGLNTRPVIVPVAAIWARAGSKSAVNRLKPNSRRRVRDFILGAGHRALPGLSRAPSQGHALPLRKHGQGCGVERPAGGLWGNRVR